MVSFWYHFRFAVWVYFALALIGSQAQTTEPYTFIPIFLVLKFIFFFGWLEVAEAIQYPFGNDADDFHICQLVSRHLWAIGKNLALHDGPPDITEDDEEEEAEDSGSDDNSDNVKININKRE